MVTAVLSSTPQRASSPHSSYFRGIMGTGNGVNGGNGAGNGTGGRGLDFQGISDSLLSSAYETLPKWLPGGKILGHEYVCGGIEGGAGDSFRINMKTGVWAEFNGGEPKGADLIDLYAEIHGLREDLGRAVRELAAQHGYELGGRPLPPVPRPSPRPPSPGGGPKPVCHRAPDDALPPSGACGKWGRPVGMWRYRDVQAYTLGYKARYRAADGSKTYFFWHWDPDRSGGPGWNIGDLPAPRPLYGLELLAVCPDAPVLLVEGELAADAARLFHGPYITVTWANGVGGVTKADWRPLFGRPVLMWPDADNSHTERPARGGGVLPYLQQPGPKAMQQIAAILYPHGGEIKIIDVSDIQQDGWDAADSKFKTFAEFRSWCRPDDGPSRVTVFAPPATVTEIPTASSTESILSIAHSEDCLTLQFSELHASNLRFTHERGWFRWDGMRWRTSPLAEITELARSFCRDYTSQDESMIAESKTLHRTLTGSRTAKNIEFLARGAKQHWSEFSSMDANLWVFNTPGGTVNLKTGAIRPHSPSDLITKLSNSKPDGSSQLWLDFLARATDNDQALVDYLQRIAGYALCGDPSEECLLFFYGPGGNGKGTFLDSIQYAMGEYAVTAGMETFTESRGDRHPTELAKLAGARLVVSQEVEEGKYWNESRIKTMTGRDIVTARFMSKDFFEYRPQFTLMISGNNKPSFKTVDDSIRRRLHLIPFNANILKDQRDTGMKEKLRAQADGIMAWMVQGCLEWQRQGLNPPPAVLEATNEYLEEEDTLSLWVKECCSLGKTHTESNSDLYASFKVWKEARGEGVQSQKKFSTNLVKMGFKRDRNMTLRFLLGLKLTESARSDSQRQSHFTD